MSEIYDVVVIGLGPNGVRLLKDLDKTNLSILGIDHGDMLNNIKMLPKWFQFASCGWRMLGIDKPGSGTIVEFIKYYEELAESLNCKKITNANIFKISGKDLNYEISYKKNNEIITFFSKKIVCSTGLYGNPRKLNVSNEIQDNILSYMPEDNQELKKINDIPIDKQDKDGNGTPELYPSFKNKTVVIIGGGNSSAMTFLNLYKHNKIYWLSRGNIGKKISYKWLNKINEVKNSPNVKFVENIKITKFGKSAVFFSKKKKKGEFSITFDICYKLIGYNPTNDLITNILNLPMGNDIKSYEKINPDLLKDKKDKNKKMDAEKYSQIRSYPCYNLCTMESLRKGIYLFGASTCKAQYFNTDKKEDICKSVFMYDCQFIAKNVVEHIQNSL